jgi:hypothetical protein
MDVMEGLDQEHTGPDGDHVHLTPLEGVAMAGNLAAGTRSTSPRIRRSSRLFLVVLAAWILALPLLFLGAVVLALLT